MPAGGLLALLDDLTTLLDDVSALSKVAAQKTAGIAGDDLAVNAEGLVGLAPERELPIVAQVAAGSFVNKLVLVPLALALPHAAITPLLMIGGTFLCYEGYHKVAHAHGPEEEAHHDAMVAAVHAGPDALKQLEWARVKGAILTDVVLSAEIVAVALGTVADEPFARRATTLALVAIGMTIGIYGLVAAIVKLDDLGLWLQRRPATAAVGRAIVRAMPAFMRTLSVVGTIAMFLVGGGIVLHGIPGAEAAIEHALHGLHLGAWPTWALHEAGVLVGGLALGAVAAGAVAGVQRLVRAARG